METETAPAIERCPTCDGPRIRRSASLWLHWLRLLCGSGKRHCLWCGRRWLEPTGDARAQLAAPALILLMGAMAWRASGAVLLVHRARPAWEGPMSDERSGPDDRGEYRMPVATTRWPKISSYFGNRFHPILRHKAFHEGLDFPQPMGTPVYPSRDGKVTAAGWAGGYGKRVVLLHDDGSTTLYGHLSRIKVAVGQEVKRDSTMIGAVGSTGLSTGPHLHFEVRDPRGRAVNPRKLITFSAVGAR